MRIVGNDPTLSRQIMATASGAISAAGKPLIVNTDGTVTSTLTDSGTASTGSATQVVAHVNRDTRSTFDSNSNRVVAVYRRHSGSTDGKANAVVGTVSGTSISFGTPVEFNSGNNNNMDICFDSSNNKVVIAWEDKGNSEYGTAIVGTVDPSDNSISFGSAVVFESAAVEEISIVFDSSNNKVVIAYKDEGNSDYGTAIVGTVSGTSISFGSAAVFNSGNTLETHSDFDSTNNKVIIGYRDNGNYSYGTAIVGTVSGTSISFGTEVVFRSGTTNDVRVAHNPDTGTTLFTCHAADAANQGQYIIGSVSGTAISFPTDLAQYTNDGIYQPEAVYDTLAKKMVITNRNDTNSQLSKTVLTISGTTGTADHAQGAAQTVLDEDQPDYVTSTYDSSQNAVVTFYADGGNNGYLTAIAHKTAYSNVSLTSENFIGTSAHAAADGAKVLVNTQGAIDENIPQIAQTAGFGSVVQYDSSNLATGDSNALAFDSSNNKVVLIYRDNGNSNYGTALVGTIDTSDDSISWGSATVFESASIGGTSLTFDSSNNKVVGFFKDIGDSNKMKGIVGTVSGTSISFGSATDVSTAGADFAAATFDTNSNKVVVAFTDTNNSGYGTARVGTVSGTSISFGTAVVYTSAEANHEADSITFDSSNNRVVIAYTLSSGTNRGNAIVGTVSGTDISFGTQVAFNANFSAHQTATFDTSNNKVVIAFQDSSNSDQGTAVVGTVDSSDNSISFGSEAIFNAAGTDTISSTFDSTSNTVLIAYRDAGDSSDGVVIVGTVSGTSISFGSENKYSTGTAYRNRIIYDSNAKRAVVIYSEGDQSNRGDSIVFRPAANLDLTAGQTYFVQTDGSLSETADSPSVTAGTALSTDKLLVKG